MVPKFPSFVAQVFAFLCVNSVRGEIVGVVRNLTAELITNDQTQDYFHKYGSFRLNVSWLEPLQGKRPSSYSIFVTNFPREENSTREICPEESQYYTSHDPKKLNILLPQNQVPSVVPEFSIRPNCSYKITVFANPRTKSTLKTDVIFTVPECAGDTCVCDKIRNKLPIPRVGVLIEKNETVVKWNVTSNSNVKSYAISRGVSILKSSSGLTVYNKTKVDTVSVNTTFYVWKKSNILKHGNLENGQKILVTAIDENGCLGFDGDAIIFLPESDNFLQRKFIWFGFAGIIGVCILLLTLKLLTGCKEKFYNWLPLSSTRIEQCVPKRRSTWTESILLNHNILYVEQNVEVRHNIDEDELEVPFKSVKLIRKLGEGQFGRVFLGNLENNEKQKLVAVKMSLHAENPAENHARKQLIEEIEMIKTVGPHEHLVKLIGYCTSPRKPLCIIFEYMEGGDLLLFLRSRKTNQQKRVAYTNEETFQRQHRPSISETLYTTLSSGLSSTSTYTSLINSPLRYIDCYNIQETGNQSVTYVNVNNNFKTIDESLDNVNGPIHRDLFIKFAKDIASGMAHLEAKGITHRDLAARNILLTADLTLKISDFGLSRNGVYVMSGGRKGSQHLPIRWMSPEALRERAFSSKSDVWSYGIVLWEIATLGMFPYPDVQDDQLLYHVVHNKGHPEQPHDISQDIYEIMQLCWNENPDARPTFAQLLMQLQVLRETVHLRSASNPCYNVLS